MLGHCTGHLFGQANLSHIHEIWLG